MARTPTPPIGRILAAGRDDAFHRLVRSAIVSTPRVDGEPGPSLVRAARSAGELGKTTADLLIVDAPGDLFDGESTLPAAIPAVLFYVHDDADLYAVQRLSEGGPDPSVLPGPLDVQQLAAAIPALLSGLRVGDRLPPAASGQPGPAGQGSGAVLSPRERQILSLVADGLRNREIGAVLDVSENTVKFHLASLYGKLGVAGRAQAVKQAIRVGLLSL